MKKLLLLALAMAGYVGTLSATDYSVHFDQDGNWYKLCDLEDTDGDGVYSAIVNMEIAQKMSWQVCTIQLCSGESLDNNWSNALWANFDVDASILSSDYFTLSDTYQKSGKLQIPITNASPYTYAIRLDYKESDKTIRATRLIEFASSNDDWHTSNPVYMEETAHNSGIFISELVLPAGTEFKFVSNIGNNESVGWYGNSDNSISTSGTNIKVSTDGFYKITANFFDYTYVAPEFVTVPATISSVGYSTFSSAYPVDFTDVSDVTAYRATQTADNKVLLTKVSGKVAANTGLVLKGTSTSIPTAISGTSYTSSQNLLVASVDDTTVTPGGTYYYYFLAGSSLSDIGFYQLASSSTSGAGKAYLATTVALASEINGVRAAWIFDDETQGISSVEGVQPAGVVYDLQGRVASGVKAGLYIKNGKKVVLK